MPILFLAFLIIWNKNLIFQTGLLVFMALCATVYVTGIILTPNLYQYLFKAVKREAGM